jgi:hypothetical protein
MEAAAPPGSGSRSRSYSRTPTRARIIMAAVVGRTSNSVISHSFRRRSTAVVGTTPDRTRVARCRRRHR